MRSFFIYFTISIIFLYLNLTPVVREIRGISLSVTAPVSYAFLNLYNGGANAFSLLKNVQTTKLENKKLKNELEQSQLKLSAALLIINDNKYYEDEVKKLNNNNLIEAKVIGQKRIKKNVYLVVDRGLEDNINEGDSVSFNGFLVGIVESTTTRQSTIRTINNSDLKIPVESAKTGALGIFNCEFECVVDEVLTSDEVYDGDLFIASGSGGKIKRGLLVGSVSKYESEPQELFKKIYIKNSIDTSRLSRVFIVK
ncbi:hypothetical protein COV24_04420 [candidate division WWE3 bacterium CG10_big_fil_rev_8_21_14_0_10_32_10]|uniref:Cell shape-determining protein MreC n=1 Tax=candidate division WWE3 bacterium CG10_big_fil_rev_8_21_14_0_10_32_10 TaxID=1975090 RepID=A0A2H0R9A1_UNCKA|nr:MAG: hypothetical protein COV24_04420 [candidate division WWE3 bacterium CG10_big_fil_rev_8_21_14_0_10_32_10]